jgi:hypothetical protein
MRHFGEVHMGKYRSPRPRPRYVPQHQQQQYVGPVATPFLARMADKSEGPMDVIQKAAQMPERQLVEFCKSDQVSKAQLGVLIADKAEARRRDGESREQAFTRYICSDPTGIQLFAIHQQASGPDWHQQAAIEKHHPASPVIKREAPTSELPSSIIKNAKDAEAVAELRKFRKTPAEALEAIASEYAKRAKITKDAAYTEILKTDLGGRLLELDRRMTLAKAEPHVERASCEGDGVDDDGDQDSDSVEEPFAHKLRRWMEANPDFSRDEITSYLHQQENASAAFLDDACRDLITPLPKSGRCAA